MSEDAIAAAAALLRPDMVGAVALLSVAYTPPNEARPTDVFRMMGGDNTFYIDYFQAPGVAEAEIAAAMRLVHQTLSIEIEGAAGVAMAVYLREQSRQQEAHCAVVICGGNIACGPGNDTAGRGQNCI